MKQLGLSETTFCTMNTHQAPNQLKYQKIPTDQLTNNRTQPNGQLNNTADTLVS